MGACVYYSYAAPSLCYVSFRQFCVGHEPGQMAVLLETSLGEIVVDLFVDLCPELSRNFLKLCKLKYYHGCLVYNVQQNCVVQMGDPTATGRGGASLRGILAGAADGTPAERFLQDDPGSRQALKHDRTGLISMATMGRAPGGTGTAQLFGSQFFFTTRAEDLEHLNKEHAPFGEVAEGADVLANINALYVDGDGRPYQDVRLLHAHVLDDPFDDPPELLRLLPPTSPTNERPANEAVTARISASAPLDEHEGRTAEEIEESLKQKEAQSRATVLEMIGDIPDADVKPPENVLFVCKLNAVTTDEDLEIIFARFGKIVCCEVIRDHVTGESLNYAFIEFEDTGACEEAYLKMNNVLIDDRRIKVDFSQSVAKIWNKYTMRPRSQRKMASANERSAMSNAGRPASGAGATQPARGDRKRDRDAYPDDRGTRDSRHEPPRPRFR